MSQLELPLVLREHILIDIYINVEKSGGKKHATFCQLATSRESNYVLPNGSHSVLACSC